MKHAPTPADQRRTHDLGFADEGPNDVATLRRNLTEQTERAVRYQAALEAIGITAANRHRTATDRLRSIRTTVELALNPKED